MTVNIFWAQKPAYCDINYYDSEYILGSLAMQHIVILIIITINIFWAH